MLLKHYPLKCLKTRHSQRLEAILRSSLYSHFSESLSGIATIRAYNEEGRFLKENRDRMNNENRAYWMTVTNQVCRFLRWTNCKAKSSSSDGSVYVLTFSGRCSSWLFPCSPLAPGLLCPRLKPASRSPTSFRYSRYEINVSVHPTHSSSSLPDFRLDGQATGRSREQHELRRADRLLRT